MWKIRRRAPFQDFDDLYRLRAKPPLAKTPEKPFLLFSRVENVSSKKCHLIFELEVKRRDGLITSVNFFSEKG